MLALYWIAATVAGFWFLPKRWQAAWLISCTSIFLIHYAFASFVVMLIITGVIGVVVKKWRHSSSALFGAIFLCFIALIGYRAYSDFFNATNTAILLGFAFYIMRAIHFLMEAYRGKIQNPSWKDIIRWFWFLPTLQVGPIHRFEAFTRDSQRSRWDAEYFNQGLRRIVFGYVKVVVIGNQLFGVELSKLLTKLDAQSWLYHYLDTVQYGVQLYVRFAGYSDIAIGFALLLGYRIMENFNSPFLARSITDFWQRWHISLSSWCREYIYTPVFSFTRTPVYAAMASMLILGLWHEFSWRYLLWSVFHGVAIAVCQQWQRSAIAVKLTGNRLWSFASLIITQHIVLFSFTFTGLNTMQETLARWYVLFGVST